jgi:ribosome-associated protein
LATAYKTARKPRSASKAAPATSNAKKTAPAKSVAPKTAPRKPRTAKPVSAKSDPVDILRRQVLAALDELKAKDVHEIDVRGKTSIADVLIIASGTSTRHVKSLADEVVRFVKKAGMMPLGVEGQREAEWVLVDLGDIIVHVMLPRIREFYGLERLWTVGDDMPAVAANSD